MARQVSFFVAAATLFLNLQHIQATSIYFSESSRLKDLSEKMVSLSFEQSPYIATFRSVEGFNDKLPPITSKDNRAIVEKFRRLLVEIRKLDLSKLSAEEKVTFEILNLDLVTRIRNYELGYYYFPFTKVGGYHQGLIYIVDRTPLRNVQDYENYIARIEKFTRFTRDHISVLREGVQKGYTIPKVVLEGYLATLDPHASAQPHDSVLFKPFLKFPDSISMADRDQLKERALKAISKKFIAELKLFRTFFQNEYFPKLRSTVGLSDVPNGLELYQHKIYEHTTLQLKPRDVHELGLSEVRRIRKEMDEVISKSGFKGTFSEFTNFLRTDSQFYPKSEAELLNLAKSITARIQDKLHLVFGRIPKAPLVIEPYPAHNAPYAATAGYTFAGGAGVNALEKGIYYVNTYNLKSRPLYEMEALSLHEGIPGHHMHFAIQAELKDLSYYRKIYFGTAFTEGWGLYAESLGREMGFYQDLYSNFGRLSYEMWRACRLVVDSGIHAFGWTRAQAIQFMLDNSALTEHNAVSEVDRYITNPGQALAYKVGELKIKELRAKAARELGNKFDVREFHDRVLESGTIPLMALERKIEAYIQGNN